MTETAIDDVRLAEMAAGAYDDAPVPFVDASSATRVRPDHQSSTCTLCDVYQMPDGAVAVAFRGTTSPESWLLSPVMSALSSEPHGWGRVHTGVLRAWTALRGLVEEAVGSRGALYVTGHSIGGGLATLAAAHFSELDPERRVVCRTFGAPRVFGPRAAKVYDRLPNVDHVRYEGALDLVPRLPALLARYRAVGRREEVLGAPPAKLLSRVAARLSRCLSSPAEALAIARDGHNAADYLRALEGRSLPAA